MPKDGTGRKAISFSPIAYVNLLFDNFHGNLPSHLRLAQAKSQEAKATQPDANALSLIRNSKQPILPHLSQHLRRLGVILQHLHALPVEIGALCREARAAVDARKTTAANTLTSIQSATYTRINAEDKRGVWGSSGGI
jgi:hypothetical protein